MQLDKVSYGNHLITGHSTRFASSDGNEPRERGNSYFNIAFSLILVLILSLVSIHSEIFSFREHYI